MTEETAASKSEYTTLKIRKDLAAMLRAISALEAEEQISIADSILRPALKVRYEKAVRDAAKRLGK